MGIYDRDYLRDDEPGFHARLPQTMVVRLMVFTGIVYFVQILFDAPDPRAQPIADIFALSPKWFRHPWKIYQLLTYGFLHSRGDIFHILFNMFGLWIFGRDLEARYGSREFLLFYLTAIVVAGLVWTLAELPFGGGSGVLGASGGVVATAILFAFNFPTRQILLFFVIPMQMWVAACLFVGADILGALNRSDTSDVAFTAHLGGALFAVLYYKLNWRLNSWIPWRISLPKFRTGPKLRVHRPDEEDDMSAKVDAILDKISKQGSESLTRGERKLLERASHEYQQKRK